MPFAIGGLDLAAVGAGMAAADAGVIGAGALAGGAVADGLAADGALAAGEGFGDAALGGTAAGVVGAGVDALGGAGVGTDAALSGLSSGAAGGTPAAVAAADSTLPSTTASLAQSTADTGVAQTASQALTPAEIDSAQFGGPSTTGAGVDITGAAPAKTGIIDQLMNSPAGKWADSHQRLASGVLQAGGAAVGGIAKGALGVMQAAREAQAKKDFVAWQRQFIQSGAQGGPGVTVPLPTNVPPLTTMSGQPVYGPNGIIARRMMKT